MTLSVTYIHVNPHSRQWAKVLHSKSCFGGWINFPSIKRFKCQSLWSIEWNLNIPHGFSRTDKQLMRLCLYPNCCCVKTEKYRCLYYNFWFDTTLGCEISTLIVFSLLIFLMLNTMIIIINWNMYIYSVASSFIILHHLITRNNPPWP